MSIVWVTQETQYDFTEAEKFGEVRFLTTRDLNNNRNSQHNEALMTEIAHRLRKFDYERDYIVIAGSPYVSALVFLLLGLRHERAIRILRWDNRDLKYTPLHLELRREVDASGAQS